MSLWSNPFGTSSSSSSYYSYDQVKSFAYFYGNTLNYENQEELEENEVMPKELITFDPKDLRL